MQNTKKAFSFVEIIITISIITLLAVIWLSTNQGYKDNIDNTKIISDIKTINNALESYAQENKSLPMPWGNTNFYKIDTSYAHSYTWSGTFWVYGSITENTLPKKYLDVLPLDPRTNNYYSYWKTKGREEIVANQFELAWVQMIDWEYQAFVTWNYTAEAWPYNLIREYNGSNFVYDKSKTNLPYNPEELILIAKADWILYREWDTIEATSWDLEIYFSDGSVSVLEDWWELTLTTLSFPNEDNLNTLVKLSLWAWTIWTKATHLNDNSKFEVYTTDSTAAVRGTIFWVKKDAVTEVIVIEWEVEVYRNDDFNTTIIDLRTGEKTRIIDWYINWIPSLKESDYDNIKNNFIVKADIRGADTVAMINQEIMNAIPCTFIVDWYEMCDEELSWMELVAYAPYNTLNDYHLYTTSSSIIPLIENLDHTSDIWDWINIIKVSWVSHNFYNMINWSDTSTWIYIDNVTVSDKLKYNLSSLSLWDEYAIEMIVKGADLKRIDNTYYLLHTDWDIKLYTYYSSWEVRLTVKKWWTNQYTNLLDSTKYDFNTNDFYSIKIISDWSKTKVLIESELSTQEIEIPEVGNLSQLFVWSKNDFTNHWNWIIDYVKLYKD